MISATQSISPLRQRMIEDMRLRKLAPKTQTGYIRAVKKLAGFLGHSPDTAIAEDLRTFQLHLVDKGTSCITINATITALRFFFEVTLDRKDVVNKLKTVPVPRKLPVVLSREEVSRLLEATGSLKYKAAFSVDYSGTAHYEITPSEQLTKEFALYLHQDRRLVSVTINHYVFFIHHFRSQHVFLLLRRCSESALR